MFSLAPNRPPLTERILIRVLGRMDRRHYQQSLDSTSTHATIRIRSLAQAGQHEVNRQYLELASKHAAANAVTAKKLESIQQAIADSTSKIVSLDGRKRDAEQKNLTNMRQVQDELKNQLAANTKTFESLGIQAQQALDSWITYYNVLASIYVRHRMRKVSKVMPTQADIPVFEPIQLAEINNNPNEVGDRDAKQP